MNYFVMGLVRYGYIPIKVTVVTVLPQVLLIIALIIHHRKDVCKHAAFEKTVEADYVLVRKRDPGVSILIVQILLQAHPERPERNASTGGEVLNDTEPPGVKVAKVPP